MKKFPAPPPSAVIYPPRAITPPAFSNRNAGQANPFTKLSAITSLVPAQPGASGQAKIQCKPMAPTGTSTPHAIPVSAGPRPLNQPLTLGLPHHGALHGGRVSPDPAARIPNISAVQPPLSLRTPRAVSQPVLQTKLVSNSISPLMPPRRTHSPLPKTIQRQTVIGAIVDRAGADGTIHYHYLYDDNLLFRLHVTFTDHRTPAHRTWNMRTYYTPTSTVAGTWSALARVGAGAVPAWARNLAISRLNEARAEALQAFHADATVITALETQFPQQHAYNAADFPAL
jgi:hypothetical protein